MAETLTPGELRAMEGALAAYRDYMARTEDAARATSRFSLGEILNDTSSRAWAIVQAQRDDYARFVDRRNELIQQQPPDHEAVLAFVEATRHAASSPMPSLIVNETSSNSGTAIVGGALLETAKDAASAARYALPVVGLVALAFIVFAWRSRS